MAHPVVIMAHEKSEAIGKAVAALEEAGLEVVVLNTAKSKLVDFLGALSGEMGEEEDEEEAPEEEPAAEEPAAEEPAPEEEEAVDKPTSEATIEGEKVVLKLSENSEVTLYPSSIVVGAKTFYTLNESQFSFWPSALSDEPIRGGLDVTVQENVHRIVATFSEQAKNPPELHLPAELYAALSESNFHVKDRVEVKASAQDAYGEKAVILQMNNGEKKAFIAYNDGREEWIDLRHLMPARKSGE